MTLSCQIRDTDEEPADGKEGKERRRRKQNPESKARRNESVTLAV